MTYTIYSAMKKLMTDRRGQDMLEYALLAATFAVVIGAVFPPTIMPSVSGIFSKVVSSFSLI